MQTVTSPAQSEQTIKKSRFIGIARPCVSELQAKDIVNRLRLEYADANHIAYAYRILTPNGWRYRIYDAGEPSGTAGKPIFSHLEGKNLINVMIAVIRYYGGIKLGAGGLTRAYGNAANEVLQKAEKQPYQHNVRRVLEIPYERLDSMMYQLKLLDAEILDQQFTNQVMITIAIAEQKLDLIDLLYRKESL